MDEEERERIERIRRETVAKWSALGFLDGLDSDRVTQLHESQAQHLVEETNGEVTTSGFETVVFPIVRRVYARLLGSEIEPFTPDLNKLDFKPYNRIKKHRL